MGEMNLWGRGLSFCARGCAGYAGCSFLPSQGVSRGCRISLLGCVPPFPPSSVRFRSGARSTLRWPMQRVAMAGAGRCVGSCSVLRFPGRCRGWFLALGLEGWQGRFCGCVERATGLHKGMWAGLRSGVCRAVKTCSRAVCKVWVCLCFCPWDGLPMVFWLSD